MKKNRVSSRKSKRRKGGHLLPGTGYSLTRTTFDNGCGPVGHSRPSRLATSRRAIMESSEYV